MQDQKQSTPARGHTRPETTTNTTKRQKPLKTQGNYPNAQQRHETQGCQTAVPSLELLTKLHVRQTTTQTHLNRTDQQLDTENVTEA